MASLINATTSSKKGPAVAILAGSAALILALATYMAAAGAFQPLALLTFFEIYLGVFAAAALGIIGLTLLLIGATAAGVRLALRPSEGQGE